MPVTMSLAQARKVHVFAVAAAAALVAALSTSPSPALADCAPSATRTTLAAVANCMGANTWQQVNVNNVANVPPASEPNTQGGPYSIFLAWPSMAYDSVTQQLLFFGGGHANYAGNEVYAFNFSNLKYQLLDQPSPIVQPFPSDSALYYAANGPFNAPIAAHTYDTNIYLPGVNNGDGALVVFGGGAYDTGSAFQIGTNPDGSVPASGALAPTGPYFFDPSTANSSTVGTWTNRNDMPVLGAVDATAAVATIDGQTVVLYSTEGSSGIPDAGLYLYNPNGSPTTNGNLQPTFSDIWRPIGSTSTFCPNTYSGQGAGAYDPRDNFYVRTSATGFVLWNTSDAAINGLLPGNPNNCAQTFTLAGVPFADYANFGMAWDSVDSKLVMWDGTGDIWTINPDAGGSPLSPGTWGVTELTPSLGEMTPFETSGFTGVLGEWDYIPSLNIFLGVTVPDINGAVTPEVWAYKLDASPQPRPPKKKLDVSLDLPEQLDVSLDFPQQISTTPEPASISIVLVGTGLAFLMRRRRTS